MSLAISKVSIIIPAFNEESNIVHCLRSISKQTDTDLDVILVNDASTDNTAGMALELAKKMRIKLQLINLTKHQERGIARNKGALGARGRYLLFIDADMTLEPNVVKDSVEIMEKNKSIGGLIIPEESVGEGFWAECKALEKACYKGDDNIEAVRFFSKKYFQHINGWDPNMISGEDWDITRRLKKVASIGRIKAKIIHNEGRLTWLQLVKKKYYYATKSRPFLQKYPQNLLGLVFFVFRPAYFRNWKLLVKKPIHTVGLVIMKFSEILAGAAGFLLSRQSNLR